LLSFENAFNKRYSAVFPLYKFYRLYEDRNSLSDEERHSQFFVENNKKTGFHILNPFFISVLRDRSIWFAPSTQFNDPWDAGGAVSILRTSAAIEESIPKLLFGEEECAKFSLLPEQERYKRIEDKIWEAFSILRFACFTKRYDSNPMWAHYADNHRGVCLEFRFMRPPPEGSGAARSGVAFMMDPAFGGHYPVRYSNEFAQVATINDIGSAIQVLHTKHPDWSYEQEVRFIKLGDPNFPGEGGTVSFYKTSLTKVILGCKVPPTLWGLAEKILDHFGYTHTELVRTEFDYRTQSLKYLKKSRKQQSQSKQGEKAAKR
jgi:hypothetical protein